jgi:hypothetical protein
MTTQGGLSFIPLYSYVDAVAALVLVAGAMKLVSAASRRHVEESAVRVALKIGQRPWRYLEPLVGLVETTVAVCVLTGLGAVVGSAAITVCGMCFVFVLVRVRVKGIEGGCGCLRLGAAEGAVSDAALCRAVGVTLGGVAGIVAFTWLPQPTAVVRVIALGAGIAATGAFLGLLEARAHCSLPRWRPWRDRTLAAVRLHPTFHAMSQAWELDQKPYLQRSVGCVDEFRFHAPFGSTTVVTFRAVRRGRGLMSVHSEVERGHAGG